MAELIPFAVPTASDKTLLVWDLNAGPTAEALHVHLGSRHKAVRHQSLPLNSSRCQELANYYFGFNGWSKRIIKLQELSDVEGREAEALAAPRGKQSVKFLCALEVVLPSYACTSPGVAVVEEPAEELEQGLTALIARRKMAQKLAVQKALSNAFQKLCIVVLESGKIAVEYRPREGAGDAGGEAELQDLIQVSCFAWEQHSQGEEDFRDFNAEEEELGLLERDQ
uniref:DM1 domain-containing protein n=1 Tax=Chinchilla lanigera TaxID=34839 RepID=A0A8C2W959_CHILA